MVKPEGPRGSSDSTTGARSGAAASAAVLAGGGEMGALMRARDWTTTPLGAPGTWPQSLRTAISILLESRFPMYIARGPEFVQFYNDGYRPILGSTKHPSALGGFGRDTFAASWHVIGPMFTGVLQGTAVGADDWMLPLDRHGYLEECYFTFSYSPIRDESGGVGGVLVTVSETTRRVLGERRLRTLRDLAARAGAAQQEADAWHGTAQALASNTLDVPFALLYRAPDGPSEAGQAQPELVATAGWEQAQPSSSPGMPAEVAEVMATGVAQLVTDLRLFGDGLPGGPWLEAPRMALVLPIPHAGASEPFGVLVAGVSARQMLDDDYRGFFQLVADQIGAAVGNARAFVAEKQRTEMLAAIDRAKTAFFSNVSHEFRTPLTLIMGPVEDGLADTTEPLPPAQRERQELVRRNALRLQKLVNTLLDLSRIEAGRGHATLVPTDLAALTAELAESFESTLAAAGLALIVDCPRLPEPTHVDPTMWEKIVLNLLSNAYKFTFEGEVRVTLRSEGDRVVLTVQDTGTGIPADELPRIFERFHRVEGARGRSHEGTGIGLALVRELVAMHGGEVEATSTLRRGTTLTVRLPSGSAQQRPGRATEEPPTLVATTIGPASFLAESHPWNDSETPAPPDSPPDSPPHEGHILVADDNADMRNYLARILSRHWTVETVADGARALAAVRARRPDLVLSDVMMPEMDGLQLVAALRADPGLAAVPVLLLSARAGEAATIEGLESGADAYLIKPFSANELVARVRAQLAAAQARQAAIRVEREHVETTERLLEAARRATRAREETLAPLIEDVAVMFERGIGGVKEEAFFTWCYAPTVDESGGIAGLFTIASETTRQVVGGRRLTVLRELSIRTAVDKSVDAVFRSVEDVLAPAAADLPFALLYTVEGDGARLVACVGVARGSTAARAGLDVPWPLTEVARSRHEQLVEGLAKMVNTLLDFSRMEAGRAQATYVPTDLAAATAGLASAFCTTIESAGIAFVVDCPPLPEAMYVDPEMWEKIVFNLLSNAVKYTHRGEIRVSLQWRDETAVLAVQDTGGCIPADELPRVFERFYRVRTTQGRSHEGTGIGLAFVNELVKLHGGTVAVTSTLGAGSTFTVTLPRGAAHLPAERVERTSRPRAATVGAASFVEEARRWSVDPDAGDVPVDSTEPGGQWQVPAALVGAKILVVDDNADLRSYVAGLLGRCFPHVTTAPDGTRALERALAQPPDLVLSDVMIPGLDGFGLVRALRADPRTRAVPIVLLSARAGDESTVEGLASGADDYLVKPFSARELLARVCTQLELARVRREAARHELAGEELREAMRMRDDWLKLVGHELRTPASALSLGIHSLVRGLAPEREGSMAPEQLRSRAHNVQRLQRRLEAQVEQLVAVSELVTGRWTLTLEMLDLGDLVTSLAEEHHGDAQRIGCTLEVRADAAVVGRFDRVRLRQALGHLVDNALKFGAGEPVHLTVTGAGDLGIVTIVDHGCGVTEDVQTRMFERFERAASADHHGGFGVGLWVARHVVEAQRGEITVHETPGGGVTLVVTLPLVLT